MPNTARQLREALGKMIQGEWRVLEKKDDTLVVGIDNTTHVEGVDTNFVTVLFEADWATDDDVNGIALMHNLLPTLLDEYEKLEREAEAGRALAEAVEKVDHFNADAIHLVGALSAYHAVCGKGEGV